MFLPTAVPGCRLQGMDLMTLENIRKLKYRYLRCVDMKRWDELGETLTSDATADYGTRAAGGPLRLEGRDKIVSYLRENAGPDIITAHLAGHPEIDVDGEQATGIWRFQDTVIATEHNVVITGAAYYHDQYRREPDGDWRIAATSFERIYETLTSMDDLPSMRLLANQWADTA